MSDHNHDGAFRQAHALYTLIENTASKSFSKYGSISPVDGLLDTVTKANPTVAKFTTCSVPTIDGFGEMLRVSLGCTNHAIVLGRADQHKGLITTKALAVPGALARTKKNFPYRNGEPAIIMTDIDPPKGWEFVTAEEYDAIICKAAPWITNVRRVYVPSASSEIYEGARLVSRKRGWHLYLIISDGRYAELFGLDLFTRLFEGGYGFIQIADGINAALLVRSLIDRSVYDASRLDFAFGAMLAPGLHQKREIVTFGYEDVPMLVVKPDWQLNNIKTWQAESPVLREKMADAKPLQDRLLRERRGVEVERRVTKLGQSREAAEAAVNRVVKDNFLDGHWQLMTSAGVLVTVRDLLSDPQAWHLQTFRDPLEHDYPSHTCAQAYLLGQYSGKPQIHSFAHGANAVYWLGDIKAAFGGDTGPVVLPAGSFPFLPEPQSAPVTALTYMLPPPPAPGGFLPPPPPGGYPPPPPVPGSLPLAQPGARDVAEIGALIPAELSKMMAAEGLNKVQRTLVYTRLFKLGVSPSEVAAHLEFMPSFEKLGKQGTLKDEAEKVFKHWSGRPVEPDARLSDFWAYLPEHKYIFGPTGDLWPAESMNGAFPPVPYGSDEDGGLLKPALWLDKSRAVHQMIWSPGHPQIIVDYLLKDGGWFRQADTRVYNLYKPAPMTFGNAAGAERYVNLIKDVYPLDWQHILYFLAHRVQRPAEKINHALVMGGNQGIGKDSILEPVKRAIGTWNAAEVSPVTIMKSEFNPFIKSVMLLVSESRDLGEVNRFAFYEHMKTLTAAPPEMLSCNNKYIRPYPVFNVTGIVYTTNHKHHGMYLPDDDRRHYVAWSEKTKADFTEEFWVSHWDWYHAGGFEDIAAYLRNLDISAFNPKAPPVHTDAFYDMVDANRSTEDSDIAVALQHAGRAAGMPDGVLLGAVTKEMLVNASMGSLVMGEFIQWASERKNAKAFGARMEGAGFVQHRNPDEKKDGQWRVNGKRQTIYVRKDLSIRERSQAAGKLRDNATVLPFQPMSHA